METGEAAQEVRKTFLQKFLADPTAAKGLCENLMKSPKYQLSLPRCSTQRVVSSPCPRRLPSFPWINTLAYFHLESATKKKKFYCIDEMLWAEYKGH